MRIAILALLALACGGSRAYNLDTEVSPSEPGVPPPCGPNVSAICEPVGPSPTLPCEPAAWIAEALASESLQSFRHRQGTSFRSHLFLGPGNQRPTRAQLMDFRDECPETFHAMPEWRASVNDGCLQEPEPCLDVQITQCETTIDAVVAAIWDVARRSGRAQWEIPIHVYVNGNDGPRCSPPETCVPPAYDEGRAEYFPSMPRYPRSSGWGACGNDGDCNNLGNLCESWIEPPVGSTLEYHGELRRAFCGCVTGECRWFVQAPR